MDYEDWLWRRLAARVRNWWGPQGLPVAGGSRFVGLFDLLSAELLTETMCTWPSLYHLFYISKRLFISFSSVSAGPVSAPFFFFHLACCWSLSLYGDDRSRGSFNRWPYLPKWVTWILCVVWGIFAVIVHSIDFSLKWCKNVSTSVHWFWNCDNVKSLTPKGVFLRILQIKFSSCSPYWRGCLF